MSKLVNVFKSTKVGSYNVDFNGSNDGAGGKLVFSQSSCSSNLTTLVNTTDFSHKLFDRNYLELNKLNEKYQEELDELVEVFHQGVNNLMLKMSKDLEKLK
jgi:hypothetical protein